MGEAARPGDAKVEHAHRAVGQEHDVFGFDVAVDDAVAVGVAQGQGGLAGNVEGLLPGQGAPLVQDLAHVLAGHVFHDQVVDVAVGAIVEHRDDVHLGRRLAEARDELGLLGEALQKAHVLAELRVEDLDRNSLPVAQVLGQVDPGHAAAAQLGDQLVAVAQSLADHDHLKAPDSPGSRGFIILDRDGGGNGPQGLFVGAKGLRLTFRETFYVVAFVKLRVSSRTGSPGPSGPVFETQAVRQYARNPPQPRVRRPKATSLAAHQAFGKKALNYLLSVLARVGQTPNTVFAQRHVAVLW